LWRERSGAKAAVNAPQSRRAASSHDDDGREASGVRWLQHRFSGKDLTQRRKTPGVPFRIFADVAASRQSAANGAGFEMAAFCRKPLRPGQSPATALGVDEETSITHDLELLADFGSDARVDP